MAERQLFASPTVDCQIYRSQMHYSQPLKNGSRDKAKSAQKTGLRGSTPKQSYASKPSVFAKRQHRSPTEEKEKPRTGASTPSHMKSSKEPNFTTN